MAQNLEPAGPVNLTPQLPPMTLPEAWREKPPIKDAEPLPPPDSSVPPGEKIRGPVEAKPEELLPEPTPGQPAAPAPNAKPADGSTFLPTSSAAPAGTASPKHHKSSNDFGTQRDAAPAAAQGAPGTIQFDGPAPAQGVPGVILPLPPEPTTSK
jgi:hypothetical protein